MLKLEGVVILMYRNSKIQLMAGNEKFSEMPALKPLVPFDDNVIEFLDRLSGLLIKHPQGRSFPEIITFGFYIRKSNVTRLKRCYKDLQSNGGRGVSFHIAPSNVPINFAYSLCCLCLAMHVCPAFSQEFSQTSIICEILATLLSMPKFSLLNQYISLVKYEHDSEINNFFSNICDLRIIWGGDNTVNELRKSPLPSRSFDITFADRYSLCIIKAAEYLALKDTKKMAFNFYNDTYLFDQNACSAPRLVYWVGSAETIRKAKEQFWYALHELLVEKKYIVQPMMAVDKFSVSCNSAINYQNVSVPIAPDNLISRIELESLDSHLTEQTCAGGSFYEYSDQALDGLQSFVTRKFQTLTYVGFERPELFEYFAHRKMVGIDRIVPCGKASEFNLIWDGYDLIRHMSRVVSVE